MYRLEELNEIQKQAVLDTEGAVLVTAGAGSGKTRLLTHRIAHLIEDLGVKPYNILAITFTNKAANEMRERLESMLDAEGIWIFTFHAACVRMLRRYIDKIGYGKNFTIYGEAETKSVVKRICKERDYDADMAKRILAEISHAKNNGIAPEDYEAVKKFSRDAEEIAAAYADYQNTLKVNNALDYDDLLILTLKLLQSDAEACEYFQDKFRYIHIDEFQDTNVIQYKIVKILAQKHGNIFAVGDEDQCIYTWRGAAVTNIFDFQRDFSCKIYKLEQNYRSTSNILDIANKIIKRNDNRLDKNLWTENADGDKVVCKAADAEGFEADYIARTIFELTQYGEYNYSDCAVLLRLNALTRPIEERFLQYGIPHRIYGGFKFYDRKEVKDVLAYARLAVNPSDDEALIRIINFPRRGIGEASIEKLRAYSRERGNSMFHTVTHCDDAPFNSALKNKLIDFGKTLVELNLRADGAVTDFFRYLLFDVLHINDIFTDDDSEARLENLNELVASVREFAKNNAGASLSDYLQMVSLYSDIDEPDSDNCVTVATVHSAKGLEFPVVFVAALEDGVFPSLRDGDSGSAHMEEERRLMYVAVTRAKRRLFLSYSKTRFLYGEQKYGIASRFLVECGLAKRTEEAYMRSQAYSRERERYSDDYYGESASAHATYGQSQKFSGAYKSDYGKQRVEQSQERADKDGIDVGSTVMHKRLGKGKVIGIEKMGDNKYVKIDFDRGGVMLLALDFAPLTVVEE
ncbi:MAG: UvrD-helicase domain-containing protein [Roseburia sp.]|nr:UvrD-helicase domain-containing protein [Roseburia sp.]